jgi:hypothetical protein
MLPNMTTLTPTTSPSVRVSEIFPNEVLSIILDYAIFDAVDKEVVRCIRHAFSETCAHETIIRLSKETFYHPLRDLFLISRGFTQAVNDRTQALYPNVNFGLWVRLCLCRGTSDWRFDAAERARRAPWVNFWLLVNNYGHFRCTERRLGPRQEFWDEIRVLESELGLSPVEVTEDEDSGDVLHPASAR